MRRHAVYETAALAEAIGEEGCASIEGALPPDLCEDTRRRIDALTPRHWDETHERGGRFLDRYLCVFNRDRHWLQFLDRPGVIDLAEAVLGADCHVVGETAWRSHPGFQGEALHVDYLPLTWPEGAMPANVRVPAFILTVHFYLNAVTADLAPTRLIAGSHRAGRAPDAGETSWKGKCPQAVIARAGDALVFRSDIWHAGSANTTPESTRYLLQVHYGRREIAQHFPPYIGWSFDPAIAAAVSKRQRRLLGDHAPGAYD
jgi:hypothetical protein